MAERVDLDAAVGRARESHRWATAEAEFVPLSTREHYGTDFPAMIAELWAGRNARERLIELHDNYDSHRDRFNVRSQVWRILREWDACDPAAGYESGDTSASQLPPPPAGVRQDLDERERRKATAEFFRTERERYEYLLACAKDAEDEELAWEPIVARVTVGDFIRAAKEVLAFRAAAGHAEPEGPP